MNCQRRTTCHPDVGRSLASRNRPHLNGSRLVLLILTVAIVGAALTVWNYSQHVFSTSRASIIDTSGYVRASFPASITIKLHPHQHARVTLASSPGVAQQAEIVSVERETLLLQLLQPLEAALIEKPMSLSPGEPCQVTIDTTLPAE